MSRSGRKKKPAPRPPVRPRVPRVGLLALVSASAELADVVLAHYAALRQRLDGVMDLVPLAVGSPAVTPALAERHGFQHFEPGVGPPGARWNAGLRALREKRPEAVIVVGPGELLDAGLLELHATHLAKGYRFLGLSDMYVLDLATRRGVRRPGAGRPQGEPLGPGRCIHAECLDGLGWRLWDEEAAEPAGSAAARTAASFRAEAERGRATVLSCAERGVAAIALCTDESGEDFESLLAGGEVAADEVLDRLRRHFAADTVERLLALEQTGTAAGWLAAGRAHLDAGRLEDAGVCLDEALALAPRDPAVLNDLGVLAFRRGDPMRAIESFVSALETDPFDRTALANASDLMLSAGCPELAAPLLRRYLGRFPDDADLRALLAACEGVAVAGPVTAVGPPEAAHRPLRILIGTHNVAAYVENLAEGFRAIGHVVHTVEQGAMKFYTDYRPDFRLSDVTRGASVTQNADGSIECVLPDAVQELLLSYDVFVFVAAHSCLPGNVDLPLLKQAGKKVISWLCGSEARHASAAEPLWTAYGSPLPEIMYRGAPTTGGEALHEVVRHGPYYNTLANKMHNVRMAELYSDLVFSVPETFALGVRPYQSIPAPLDVGKFRHHVPGRDVPWVVHAPSNRGVKRTDLIMSTLAQLRDEGVRFELHLLENVPNNQVAEFLANADVVIDEMSLYPAILSHEGMASGCAVLTGNVPEALPLPRDKPVLHIEPANLYAQTKRVLTDKALRLDLARRGRAYVEAHADRVLVAQRVLAALGHGVPDCFPHYFVDAYAPPAGERVPDYLRDLTLEVLQTHGAPPGADLGRMVRAGLLPEGTRLDEIPAWGAATRQLGPWIRCRADIWSEAATTFTR